MNTINLVENDLNVTGTTSESFLLGRCPVEQQRRSGRQATNVVIMECFYLSKPVSEDGKPQTEYRQRMCRIWQERGFFPTTEQRICDQA